MDMMLKRRELWVSIMLAVAAAVAMMACSSGARLPRLGGDAVILAFGDSLTFGTGASPGESYPAVLERLVGRRVVNAGIPGETSGQGLSRLPAVLDKERPALLILCHGGNDLLRRLNRQQTADHLRMMIRLARDRKIDVVIVAVPSPALSLSPPSFYREIAEEVNVPFEGDVLARVLADGSLKSDYIHPNAAGYRELAGAVAALLGKSGAVE
jgi:acyl-CoA thioesterase I